MEIFLNEKSLERLDQGRLRPLAGIEPATWAWELETDALTKEVTSQLNQLTFWNLYMAPPVDVCKHVHTFATGFKYKCRTTRITEYYVHGCTLNNQSFAIRVFESHRGHHYEEIWPMSSPTFGEQIKIVPGWDRTGTPNPKETVSGLYKFSITDNVHF